MRCLFVLRGIPGLGRVVASVELSKMLQDRGCHCYYVTYGSGTDYLGLLNTRSAVAVAERDITSLGIQPISRSAETIFDFIELNDVSHVFLDGEPLLAIALRTGFPRIRTISVLNPSDLHSPQLHRGIVEFLTHCYMQTDYRIVHGLRRIARPDGNTLCTHTILRRELLTFSCDPRPCSVSVVFGGGTVQATSAFHDSCQSMLDCVLAAGDARRDLHFEVFLASAQFRRTRVPPNVRLIDALCDWRRIFRSELIIARAGRNTVSEILYLNKRAVLFSVKREHRTPEQEGNASQAVCMSSRVAFMNGEDALSGELCERLREVESVDGLPGRFSPGNDEAREFLERRVLGS